LRGDFEKLFLKDLIYLVSLRLSSLWGGKITLAAALADDNAARATGGMDSHQDIRNTIDPGKISHLNLCRFINQS